MKKVLLIIALVASALLTNAQKPKEVLIMDITPRGMVQVELGDSATKLVSVTMTEKQMLDILDMLSVALQFVYKTKLPSDQIPGWNNIMSTFGQGARVVYLQWHPEQKPKSGSDSTNIKKP